MAQHQVTHDQLVQWFHYVDQDRSGYIDASELQRCLQMGGMQLDYATCDRVVRFVDDDGNGQVDFKEFAKLHSLLTKVQGAWYYFDRDRSGTLDMGEAYAAVQWAGQKALSEPTFRGVFHLMDVDRSGTISFSEFISMMMFFETTSTMNYAEFGMTYDQAVQQATAEAQRQYQSPASAHAAGYYGGAAAGGVAAAGYAASGQYGHQQQQYGQQQHVQPHDPYGQQQVQQYGKPAGYSSNAYLQQYAAQKQKHKKHGKLGGKKGMLGLLAGGLLALMIF